jgi:hypothetical protein
VDLSAFAASKNAIVKFSYKSSLGGAINIDNVYFTNPSLGIEKKKEELNAMVYPNPASNSVVVSVAANTHMQQLNVYDMQGRNVAIDEYNTTGRNTMTVNTSLLPDGLYFFNIKTDTGSSTVKVMIRK